MGWIIFLVTGYLLLCYGFSKIFPKAGFKASDAWIPGKNFAICCEIIGRKRVHAWWLLFPIVNFFIFAALMIDLVRSFGHLSFGQSFLSVVLAPLYAIYLGQNNDKYQGPILKLEREYKEKIETARQSGNKVKLERIMQKNPYKRSAIREWTESIIFAVFAAAFIRMFFIEMYKIPTPSMEGSLLVGDFLCVSKAHYGIRTPQTITMIPLLHNRVPFLNCESYLEKPNIPSVRLPAIEKIERNKPVVFNYPEGDSVYVLPGRTWSIYDVRRNGLQQHPAFQNAKLVTRPIDKKDHYIKRCIATAGDQLQIIDKQVYINGEAVENPKHMQFSYNVQSKSGSINMKRLEELGVNLDDSRGNIYFLDNDQVAALQEMGLVVTENVPTRGTSLFPHDPNHFTDWTVDNYGPISVPAKGSTITLSPENIALYKRIISVYEGNDLKIEDGKFYINGEVSSTYTFQMDYFWMMGDNRHNSEDSRVWGFVPHDHVVGKPLFIWLSTGNHGIRWKRLFTGANKFKG